MASGADVSNMQHKTNETIVIVRIFVGKYLKIRLKF